MGIRKLRGRLDQLQGKANLTMDDARELIGIAKDLVDDLTDGIGVTVHVDEGAAKTVLGLVMGKAGDLPLTVQIDPTFDTLPSVVCGFVGGPYDGKRFAIPDTTEKEMTLKGGHRYVWDGHCMVHSEPEVD